MLDERPKGRGVDSVTTAFSEGHATTIGDGWSGGSIADDETTVCRDIQMPVVEGRELLQLANTLRDSKAYTSLDRVFERMQDELSAGHYREFSISGAHRADAPLKILANEIRRFPPATASRI